LRDLLFSIHLDGPTQANQRNDENGYTHWGIMPLFTTYHR